MLIALCDADRIWAEKAKSIIITHMESRFIHAKIITYPDARSLLEAMKSMEYVFQMAFISIDEKGADGIETVKKINEIAPQCRIVYLTRDLRYDLDIYATSHIYFSTKEMFEEKIEAIIDKFMKSMRSSERRVPFFLAYDRHKMVLEEELLYFERRLRVTEVNMRHENFTVEENLTELMERLGEWNYLRCHNSYLVYLPAVAEMRRNHILLDTGVVLPISRKYAKVVQEKFARWAMCQ